ncbi:hypothetical protein ACFL2U_03615 [Patescibacteria group bacterium]
MSKKSISLIVIAVFFLTTSQIKAAKPEVELRFNEHDAIALASSMLINGLMGGFGAHYTHSPNANIWHDQNFWRGFNQGAVGGIPIYGGLKLITFQNEWEYSALAGKQLSDLGTSITFSASRGENWLDNPRYITDAGPFVFNWEKKTGFKPEITVMPASAVSTLYAFSQFELNAQQSLRSGMLIFNGTGNSAGRYNEDHRDGVHLTNIAIIPNYESELDHLSSHNYNITLGHEAMHGRQYFMWVALDATFDYKFKNNKGRLSKKLEQLLTNDNLQWGPDIGGLYWSGLGEISFLAGVPYSYIPSEYANFNLFNTKNYE